MCDELGLLKACVPFEEPDFLQKHEESRGEPWTSCPKQEKDKP
jgi:hypothetical protein